ncbi:MAG: FtsX-like permease family protein [Bacteroidota bacterium]
MKKFRSPKRTKEVGLRKVIGARRYQLTFQFLSESLILAFISLFLALMITPFILPEFNELIDRKISMNLLENSFLIPGLLIITVIIGVLSGSYPAIFMASLRPIKSLKGKLGRNSKGNRLQKSLIIAQYAVSIGMIICSVIIYQQFQFIQKKDLGFDKDQIITVRLRGSEIRSSVDVVKQELLSNPNIISVTRSQNLPTHLAQSTIVNDDRGGDPADDLDIYQLRADQDFLNVFGIELLAGEYFSAATLKNQNAPVCLINETAASAMGWSIEEAATQKFTEDWNRGDRKIIGVVKDFHMHSMHLPIAPLLIEPIRPNRGRYLSIKVRPENLKGTLNFIEKNIKQHSPYPYESRFLDDHFNDLYKDDLKQSEIFLVFTILAILIASLGLFGLAAFHINERLKEVSIRKVLGASVRSITLLFSLKFLRLVFWGFLIAIPVSIAAASYWLEFFTYRVDIEWWIFVTVGAAVASIAFFTVGIQSVKAAIANPVESLKDE